jgi:hypothetical protein
MPNGTLRDELLAFYRLINTIAVHINVRTFLKLLLATCVDLLPITYYLLPITYL